MEEIYFYVEAKGPVGINVQWQFWLLTYMGKAIILIFRVAKALLLLQRLLLERLVRISVNHFIIHIIYKATRP